MSEMRKVRVSLTGANGKVHDVVGYESTTAVTWVEVVSKRSDGNAHTGETAWHIVCVPELISPIQELPTGLGAVVEVDYGIDSERFVRVSDDGWYSTTTFGRALGDEFFDTVSFTVLSEGVPSV